jgi:RNA polymerase sigma factor (sigma-70 family)
MPAAPKVRKSSGAHFTAAEADSLLPGVSNEVQPESRKPALAGSEFSRFFEIEWPRLKRYLKRHVGSEDAEDVAQEAFARLYVHDADTRSPSGFLYQTARNLVIDGKRRARRVQAVLVGSAPMEMIADPYPSPEEETDTRQRLAQASVLFEKMSAKCRRVFLLRVIEGCSYAEIAQRLDMSSIAVEKQLLRAFEICANWNARPGGVKRRRDRSS